MDLNHARLPFRHTRVARIRMVSPQESCVKRGRMERVANYRTLNARNELDEAAWQVSGWYTRTFHEPASDSATGAL